MPKNDDYFSAVFKKIKPGEPPKKRPSKGRRRPTSASVERWRVESALKYAHQIRRFEIDLYWRRTLYFWGFIIFFMGGYGVLARSALKDDCTECTSDNKSNYIDCATLIVQNCSDFISIATLSFIACIGILVNFSWIFVERGSKSHQQNWERHIDYLEFRITGHLHKTLFSDNNGYYSLSNINRFVIRTFLMVWIVLAFAPIIIYDNPLMINDIKSSINLTIIPFIFLGGLIGLNIIIVAIDGCSKYFFSSSLDIVSFCLGWKTSLNTKPEKAIYEDKDGNFKVHQRSYPELIEANNTALGNCRDFFKSDTINCAFCVALLCFLIILIILFVFFGTYYILFVAELFNWKVS